MTGPGGDLAAAAAGRARLRASHADREQVIDLLKAAFVRGMLAKDEFDLRVSQAFTSRTNAELAAVSAGLPGDLAAEPATAQPSRPARTQDDVMQRPGRTMAAATALYAGLWAVTFLLPWPRNSEGDPPKALALLFFPGTLAYLLALFAGAVNLVVLWHRKRSGGRPAPRASS
jgi:Domain of unknown function (DUF1707)